VRAILDARLLDLSMTGARITHRTPLCPEVPYTLELPPSPGGLVLPIQVIRSTVGGTEHRPAGQRLARYESALAFVGVTAEQQATLARVLEQHPRGRWHPQATGGLRVLAPASRGTAEEFRRIHPKPPGCKGCEVDYIAPLSNADRRRGIISWREAADRKERGRPCIEHGSPFSAS